MRASQAESMNRATFDFNGAMEAEVDAFYERHPGLERTEVGAAFVARIFLQAGAAEADGPALSTHSKPQKQKAA